MVADWNAVEGGRGWEIMDGREATMPVWLGEEPTQRLREHLKHVESVSLVIILVVAAVRLADGVIGSRVESRVSDGVALKHLVDSIVSRNFLPTSPASQICPCPLPRTQPCITLSCRVRHALAL